MIFLVIVKKNWIEILNQKKEHKLRILNYKYADIPAGSKMLIATPQLIESYIKKLNFGCTSNTLSMRKDLAKFHNADHTCPISTGIFLRIIAEANYQKWQQGASIEQITPFWRMIEPNSVLAKKLTFGNDFLRQQLNEEKSKSDV